MDPQVSDALQAVLRWAHIVAGILWIGHLYFFNFVNGPFAATLDKDTKPRVVPELMPRALFWFRWGAAWTWITGVLLAGLVFYMSKETMFGLGGMWGPGAGGLVVLAVVLSPFIYDVLAKSGLGKSNKTFAWVGLVLVAAVLWANTRIGGMTYRAATIHVGAMFGTLMAFNVWFRIWPNQQKIITAVKAGQAPDAALVSQAGTRSRHNTYMSVPLIWAMINQHTTSFASLGAAWEAFPGLSMLLATALGWWVVMLFYKKAAAVKGF